jgi:hypothetical protein
MGMTSNDAAHGATQPAEPTVRRTDVADTTSAVIMIILPITILIVVGAVLLAVHERPSCLTW